MFVFVPTCHSSATQAVAGFPLEPLEPLLLVLPGRRLVSATMELKLLVPLNSNRRNHLRQLQFEHAP